MGAPLKRTPTPGVYQRGSRWCARFTLPGGRKVQRAFRSYAEACTFRRVAVEHGRPPTELELPTSVSRVRTPSERIEAVVRAHAMLARLLAEPDLIESLPPALVARMDAARRAAELALTR